jgi:K+ transporter
MPFVALDKHLCLSCHQQCLLCLSCCRQHLLCLLCQVGSTFYASIPFGTAFYWIFFTVATAAACVASQSMISAAFSIIQQSIALGCFPRLTVVHTSDSVTGQVGRLQ